MKKLLVSLTLLLLLSSYALAQSASVQSAANLAQRVGEAQELPSNVRLRFQVLAARMDALSGNNDPTNLLSFFSDSRVMIWNRPVSPNLAESMRQLEAQVVALALERGRNLDLPPVGYAPRVGGRMISTERLTAGGFANLTLQTEQIATEILGGSNSAELLFLRDNLTRLREDMADGNVAVDNVRGVLGARARFLAGDAAQYGDPRLIQKLDVLAEALRGTFPPSRLRGSRGQVVSL